MADAVDPTGPERAAADALDREVEAVLAGRAGPGTDPTLLWLASATRPEPPLALHRRIQRRVEAAEGRRWRPAQLVAAMLAAILATNGLGNLVNHDWVAENIGEAPSPHAFIEGGLALLAVSVVLAAALFTYRALPYAVAAGTPLGVALGVRGLGELGEFAAGAALHLGQGALAIALLVVWWRARRYGSAGAGEGGA